MNEVDFSLIGTPSPTLQSLLDAFERENSIKVNVQSLAWENAWHEMLLWTLYGKGPDVSHVGSTWAGSLMGMDALRPFTQADVQYVGGSEAFLPQAWQSCNAGSDGEICSLPWTAFTFVLAYRRDLLQKAGVDEAKAFASAESLLETVCALEKAGVRHPWAVPVSPEHIDTLHFTAAWVWGAGGDFLTPDGRHAAFLSPAVVDALCRYFELLRHTGPLPADEEGVLELFYRGDAAISVVGSGLAYSWMRGDLLTEERKGLIGYAPIPGVPWVGGDNLVIWKNARMSPERERAAVSLARFLASLPSQRVYARGEEGDVPTLTAALDALPLQGSTLTDAIIASLKNSRAYRPMTIWSKLEMRISQVLGEIGTEVAGGAEPQVVVRRRLEKLADWLEIVLR
jgi:multiple sugar transport system substrate-binding protein